MIDYRERSVGKEYSEPYMGNFLALGSTRTFLFPKKIWSNK